MNLYVSVEYGIWGLVIALYLSMLDLFEAGREGQQRTIAIFLEKSLALPWQPLTIYRRRDSKKLWSILLAA